MAQSNWEADKMLDVYIYDYLTKRNLQNSAKAFLAEGKVSSDPVAIDAPGGFLFEWWSVFWDIFIARTNEKHSEVAAAYIETQQLKAREQQQQLLQQQQPQNQQQQHQQQLQLHQMQLMRHAQPQQQQQQQAQPRRDLAMNGSAEALLRQSTPTANAMAAKIYEERLKLDESALKRYDATPLDANQAALMKTTSTPGQPSGPVHSGAVSNSIPGAQARPQQMLQDNKSDIHMLNQRSPATDPSLFNVKSNLLTPANQGASKSWSSLAGMDQRLMQPQKPFLQSSSQAYQQLHGLTSHQQQLLYQAQPQGSIPSSGLADMDPQRFRMLLNRSGLTGKVGQTNVLNDPTSGVGSPVQAASPLSRATSQDQTDLVLKMKLAQMQQQQSSSKLLSQQNSSQQQQQPISQQQQPISQQQQERMGLAGVDGTISSYRSNDQIYGAIEPSPSNNSTGTGKTTTKNQNGRKRKQPASSSGPANSTGTANTAGRSPNSPSTPSTHTPGDVMSMGGAVHQIGGISKSSMMYGTEGHGTLASPSNQLADIDRLGEDGSLDDNVESFLSHEEADPREGLFGSNKRTPNVDVTKGFTFNEVGCLHASTNKVVCCHFSSDGKLLASAGHEKKAVLWNMDTLKLRSTLEEHSFLITDVRFSPNSTRLATSSFDKTVRVWDADNPSYSLRTFTGHQTSVMSLDFHPTNEDLLCSCDGDSEIRYWSVSQGVCTRVFKGGMTQTRFQPRHGRYLAAAAENVVSIFDVETETCRHSLQRHTKPVHSVCWDATGEYLASVSEDSVRVWTLRPGSDGECVHELSSNGNKFHSCVFHPNYPTVLIIGCYESLELWNMTENKSMTIQAHNGLIAALAQSPASGMVASASHDKCVKLWK